MTQRKLLPLRGPRGQQPFVYSGFRLDEQGLTPVGTPTRAQWSACLDYLMHLEKHVHFWIGDLLNYGEGRWGEMYADMIEQTGYDYRTLGNLKWVAARIELSRRRENLSFAHHQEVASLPPDQQEFILARAEHERRTRERVRHEVNRLAYEVKRPAGLSVVSGLHYGDCREVMATLPDESIDLLLTDPLHDSPEALAVVDHALACATDKLKPNSHVYVFTTWQMYADTAAIVERHFALRNTLVWVANNGVGENSDSNYGDQHELILFAHKGRRHLNGRRDSDVLHFEGVEVPQHPAEKPVALLQYLVEKSTQAKETVLDPFMGTGSACVAASNAQRWYVGIESDRQWYEQALQRLAPTVGA